MKKKNFHLTTGIFLVIIAVYYSMHYAYIAYNHFYDYKILQKLSAAVNDCKNVLNTFKFNQMYMKDSGLLLIWGAVFVLLALLYADWIVKKDMHAGEEKGKSKWGDVLKFKKEYGWTSHRAAKNMALNKAKNIPNIPLIKPLIVNVLTLWMKFKVTKNMLIAAKAQALHNVNEKKREKWINKYGDIQDTPEENKSDNTSEANKEKKESEEARKKIIEQNQSASFEEFNKGTPPNLNPLGSAQKKGA